MKQRLGNRWRRSYWILRSIITINGKTELPITVYTSTACPSSSLRLRRLFWPAPLTLVNLSYRCWISWSRRRVNRNLSPDRLQRLSQPTGTLTSGEQCENVQCTYIQFLCDIADSTMHFDGIATRRSWAELTVNIFLFQGWRASRESTWSIAAATSSELKNFKL